MPLTLNGLPTSLASGTGSKLIKLKISFKLRLFWEPYRKIIRYLKKLLNFESSRHSRQSIHYPDTPSEFAPKSQFNSSGADRLSLLERQSNRNSTSNIRVRLENILTPMLADGLWNDNWPWYCHFHVMIFLKINFMKNNTVRWKKIGYRSPISNNNVMK